MKFTLQNAKQFGWEGVKGFEYSNKNDFQNVSIAYAEISGRHGKIKNTKSDRVYIIFEGKGEFILNDKVFFGYYYNYDLYCRRYDTIYQSSLILKSFH